MNTDTSIDDADTCASDTSISSELEQDSDFGRDKRVGLELRFAQLRVPPNLVAEAILQTTLALDHASDLRSEYERALVTQSRGDDELFFRSA